jgi:hypothetical protein
LNCLFFNTRYNLHSVTSNATANAISEEVTNRNTAISNAINIEVANRNTAIANAVNNAVGYSTTETFTGSYWINGKPIYRLVVTYNGTIPAHSNDWSETGISNNGIDELIDCRAINDSGTLWNFLGVARDIGNTLKILNVRNIYLTIHHIMLWYTRF